MFSFQFYAFLIFVRFIILGLIKQKFQQESRYICSFILKIITILDSLCLYTLIRIYIEEIYFDVDYS